MTLHILRNSLTNSILPSLPLDGLADRHTGLTPALADCYVEVARVCLDQFHTSPKEFTVEDDEREFIAKVAWNLTNDRDRNAWANTDDAVRDGAYAFAIATVEMARGLFAVRRAETRTGADYYIALADRDQEDMENWLRLEVSGTNSKSKSEVKSRLRSKLEQAKRGNSNLPALASVIGFRVQLILLQTVDEAS
jgi:hypothetical protein